MKHIISMSGDIGGGKSSVAKSLNEMIGYKIIGTGSIQRNIALQRGMTTLELNEISKTDRSVDDEIDSYVIKLGVSEENLIIDSRLAWHFIPDSFKVYLSVNSTIGGERVYESSRNSEHNPSLEATIENNSSRQKMESDRFKNLYDINFRDYSNYDLVIDTSYAPPTVIAQKILESFNKWTSGSSFSKFWLSPQILIPTHDIKSIDAKEYEEIHDSIKKSGFLDSASIDVVMCHDFAYIWDGHKRVIAATKAAVDLLPAKILTSDPSDELTKGLSVSSIASGLSPSFFYDWEDALDFKYKSYPKTMKTTR